MPEPKPEIADLMTEFAERLLPLLRNDAAEVHTHSIAAWDTEAKDGVVITVVHMEHPDDI